MHAYPLAPLIHAYFLGPPCVSRTVSGGRVKRASPLQKDTLELLGTKVNVEFSHHRKLQDHRERPHYEDRDWTCFKVGGGGGGGGGNVYMCTVLTIGLERCVNTDVCQS